MTYIELINMAWELREQGVITVYEHDLYCYLVHKCNRLYWKNPFHQSSSVICAVMSINKNALAERRKRLKQLGLITYKEGTARLRPAEYTISAIARTGKNGTVKVSTVKGVMQRPSLQEISNYCEERGNNVDARAFYDFYQSIDWLVGRNPMKNWQAAVRSWEKKKPKATKHNFAAHDNDKKYDKF